MKYLNSRNNLIIMMEYKSTQNNYNLAVDWHTQKSLSYNWHNQIEKFAKTLHGKIVLDAGCGGGRDIPAFLKKGYQVEGIDFSSETIKRCREQFPEAKFFDGDIRKMDLPDKKYDGLWASASILNLKKADVPKALSEFKRVLKKGGTLYISVKEGSGQKMIPDQAGKRLFSFFSENELAELVIKTGFKILYKEVITDATLTGKLVTPPSPNWICVYATKEKR